MSTVSLVLWIIFLPFIAYFLGVLLLGWGKKYTARLQRRYGPYLFQVFFDSIKLLRKRTNISHGWMQDVSVLMLLGGTILTMYFVPFPGFHFFSQYGDFLVVMYLILVPSLGMALGVGETANPNGSIGISRALQMLAGYDIPFALAFIGMAMIHGSTNFYELILRQQELGIAGWGIVTNPFLGIAALFALHGMMGEKPFEVVIAPHEIATGPMTEMGGKYMGMMMITHALQVVVELTIFINLFLGGAENWITYIIKIFALFTIILSVNAVFGRFRVDDAVRFFWKIPLPLAVIGVIFVMI
ncbi:MAG: NADH-quinone oxidoreductase subunit H [Spirochaetales bacterium]|nr:NADH-quinone oxidoreductase subunit H [Spirochaetales bacterium]MCF7939428.1 NADH-quinone oxidoreductase subunit H [Spirochaetales bacterium]